MARITNYVDILAETGRDDDLFVVYFPLAWMGYKLCIRLRARGDFTTAMPTWRLPGRLVVSWQWPLCDWLLPSVYARDCRV